MRSKKQLKNKHGKSLQALIHKTKKRPPLLDRFRIRELYYPSIWSFGFILIVVVLFFVLSHFIGIPCFISFNNKLTFLESNHFQNLIAIHAGIGAIIFALVIFIAESLRDDDLKDKARVLLKESFLFPLAVAEILTFFVFIWGDINAWAIVPILIIGAFTIYSLARLVRVLLNRYQFAIKREELLKERLKRCIDLEIDERIGNNILFSKLGNEEIKLEYNFFGRENEKGNYCFKADNSGIVVDIRLDKLRKIAEEIEEEANRNGFSYSENKPDIPIFSKASAIQKANIRIMNKLQNRYILKRYRENVTDESNTLICVDKKLLKNKRTLEKIEVLVKQAFIIRPESNYVDEVRMELSGTKDQFIAAIDNKQTGKVEEYINLYKKLAESFLESINALGGGYSAEQAAKERHAFLGGWKGIEWLSTDIREILENAVKSEDQSIADGVAFLPFGIAARAIKYKDHFLFQEFIRFAEIIYYMANKIGNEDIKAFLKERSWRYLQDIAKYYVETELVKQINNENEIIAYKDFAVHFYKILLNLIKNSYKEKDIKSFEEFVNVALRLFEQFRMTDVRHDIEITKWEMGRQNISSEQKKEFEITLKNQVFWENIGENILLRRNQMFFGIASWILSEYKQSDKTDNQIKKYYDLLQKAFPSDIVKFTELFMKTHTFEVEHYWGWGWWDIKEEGKVQIVSFLEKLELFYALKSLLLLSSKKDEEIKIIKLPHSRDFAFLVEGARDLKKILEDVSKNPDNWRFILPNEAIKKVDPFIDLLNDAKKNQEEEELTKKRESKISLQKVSDFKKELIREFYARAGIRSILKYYGLYKDEMKQIIYSGENRFGIEIVDDKAVFFEKWYIHYSNWGNEYGRSMAHGENRDLIDEIENKCIRIKENELEVILKEFPRQQDIIFIVSGISKWDIEDKNKFIPKWRDDKNIIENEFFYGWFIHDELRIPVYQVFPQKDEDKLFILDKNRLGTLIQRFPLNENEEKINIEDVFYVNIKAFSEDAELIEEFIKKRIHWLEKYGDENKQRLYLQERVLINIYEKFEFNKSEHFQGFYMMWDKN